MNNSYFNRGSFGQQKNAIGVLGIVMVVFGAIAALTSGSCGTAAFFPLLFFLVPVFIIVSVIKSSKNQSPQGVAPPPYSRSPYRARPGQPNYRQSAAPRYAPQPARPPINYDSHLCEGDAHPPESPREQRAVLNQLQSGYGTQATRKDRKHPSRAYDINNHNEGLKALLEAGIMTPEEYESMSRR